MTSRIKFINIFQRRCWGPGYGNCCSGDVIWYVWFLQDQWWLAGYNSLPVRVCAVGPPKVGWKHELPYYKLLPVQTGRQRCMPSLIPPRTRGHKSQLRLKAHVDDVKVQYRFLTKDVHLILLIHCYGKFTPRKFYVGIASHGLQEWLLQHMLDGLQFVNL